LFRPSTPGAYKRSIGSIASKQYLMGGEFSVADAYMCTGAAQIAARQHRHLQMAGHQGLRAPRRRPAESAGSPQG